jgi:hypothetical protein
MTPPIAINLKAAIDVIKLFLFQTILPIEKPHKNEPNIGYEI